MPSIITVGGLSSTGNGTKFGDLIEKVYRRWFGLQEFVNAMKPQENN